MNFTRHDELAATRPKFVGGKLAKIDGANSEMAPLDYAHGVRPAACALDGHRRGLDHWFPAVAVQGGAVVAVPCHIGHNLDKSFSMIRNIKMNNCLFDMSVYVRNVTYTEAMCGQIWPWKGPVYVTNATYTEAMRGQIWPWKGPVYVIHVTYTEAMCGQIWLWKGPVYVTHVTYTEAMRGQIWPCKGPVHVTNVTYTEAMWGQIWP